MINYGNLAAFSGRLEGTKRYNKKRAGRIWGDKGNVWLVIDPYGFVNPRGVLEKTLSDLLIDTNIQRLDVKAVKIIQLHSFSKQLVRINNDLLKEKGGAFEQMLPHLK
ncbi:hypothetical protein [Weissella cibaria]|uniref:hypothetical protein n=1 Tax=Weissella cibaria TaxID=137591 RepID=UPI001C200D5B|nr:hypothetical protein [Weissella cibaria]